MKNENKLFKNLLNKDSNEDLIRKISQMALKNDEDLIKHLRKIENEKFDENEIVDLAVTFIDKFDVSKL